MAFWRKKPGTPPPVPGAPGPSPDTPTYDDPPTQFLSGDPLTDRHQVRVLLDAIAKVSESRDLDSLLQHVVDSAVETTGAEQGLLIMLDEEGGQSVRVARTRELATGLGRAMEGEVKYSTSVVGKVLKEDSPLRTTVQTDAEALELGASVFDLKLRAVMCVPLSSGQESQTQLRGALYVDSKAATREFKDEDLSLFYALAQHIAIALENAQPQHPGGP